MQPFDTLFKLAIFKPSSGLNCNEKNNEEREYIIKVVSNYYKIIVAFNKYV